MTIQRSFVNTFVLVILAVALALGAVVTNPGARTVWQNLMSNQAWQVRAVNTGWQTGSLATTPGYRYRRFARLRSWALPADFKSPKCDDGRAAQYQGAYQETRNGVVIHAVFECLDDGGGIIKSMGQVFRWTGGGNPPSISAP